MPVPEPPLATERKGVEVKAPAALFITTSLASPLAILPLPIAAEVFMSASTIAPFKIFAELTASFEIIVASPAPVVVTSPVKPPGV